MTPETQAKLAQYIELSSAIAAATAKQAAERVKEAAEVEQLLPAIVDNLVKQHKIGEDERAEAFKQLREHKQAAAILLNVITPKPTEEEVRRVGQPVKNASEAPPRRRAFIGESSREQADQNYLARLGIN